MVTIFQNATTLGEHFTDDKVLMAHYERVAAVRIWSTVNTLPPSESVIPIICVSVFFWASAERLRRQLGDSSAGQGSLS